MRLVRRSALSALVLGAVLLTGACAGSEEAAPQPAEPASTATLRGVPHEAWNLEQPAPGTPGTP
ncbi:hypothetical protein LG634_16600 [Streptomyces bambusae]|uniref:hypothetical protein n=1 Tax=Streptomyces bambusae TaxID=1550616 RepID=UPI001CFE4E01|nr:hypothetical protein [Streptomyces bambusae]MCB5166452.1 hypothetical protein [Streptomyces bambusae]